MRGSAGGSRSGSSAPEGAMLSVAPQDEPWDEEMELLSDGASSGEVSVVTKRGWSHLPPSLCTLAGAGERGPQTVPVETAGRRSKRCPNCAFFTQSGRGPEGSGLGMGSERLPRGLPE